MLGIFCFSFYYMTIDLILYLTDLRSSSPCIVKRVSTVTVPAFQTYSNDFINIAE